MLDIDIRHQDYLSETKCAIINSVWNCQYSIEDFYTDSVFGESYIRYYRDQCGNAAARRSDGLEALVSTHQDVVNIIDQLRDLALTREQIEEELKARVSHLPSPTSEEIYGEAIDLCVRLWLMLDVGNNGKAINSFVPGQKRLPWCQGRIKDVLALQFTPQISSQERVKMGKIFNARNLERIAGLQIVWTSNLADHLRLTADDTRIAIFHHASFLNAHKDSQVFPPGLIKETLSTLSLLLPQDRASRKWFQAQQVKSCLDNKAISCGHLSTEDRQIENFYFWRDRLVILKQVFDEAEPSTIAQWWCDRRRRVQWYTFWVAALVLGLTIFFGTIQCIEGGLQVYKAYHPS